MDKLHIVMFNEYNSGLLYCKLVMQVEKGHIEIEKGKGLN
jgi:hypothetical protein